MDAALTNGIPLMTVPQLFMERRGTLYLEKNGAGNKETLSPFIGFRFLEYIALFLPGRFFFGPLIVHLPEDPLVFGSLLFTGCFFLSPILILYLKVNNTSEVTVYIPVKKARMRKLIAL